MKITSAGFLLAATNKNNIVHDDLPQIAFIGRSNVGKSTLINSLTGNSKLARSSSTAGRTREINFFLINKEFYLVDLPGYGYARGSLLTRNNLFDRITEYLFRSDINHNKVVLIIDAKVGMTDNDVIMFEELKKHNKNIFIIVNKIDKAKQSEKQTNINFIKKITKNKYPIFTFSSTKKIKLEELKDLIMSDCVKKN